MERDLESLLLTEGFGIPQEKPNICIVVFRGFARHRGLVSLCQKRACVERLPDV